MLEYKPHIKSVTAFAPATCANVAVGFDLLGFPLENIGDTVTLTIHEKEEMRVEVSGPMQSLPLSPDKNIASSVVKNFCHDYHLTSHFTVSIKKGIPIGSGMGGSAASAVAALVALNAFLKQPVSIDTLASYTIEGEAMVSGSKHGDNVVPCLLGGLTLTQQIDPLKVIQLPVPNIFCVLVHPNLRIDTRMARAILPSSWELNLFVKQSANLASFIAALYQNDITLLQDCLQDVLIEPIRSKLVNGFDNVKQAALSQGALGASLSGSGPSIFALCETKATANLVRQAMLDSFNVENIEAQGWVSRISTKAASVISTEKVNEQ